MDFGEVEVGAKERAQLRPAIPANPEGVEVQDEALRVILRDGDPGGSAHGAAQGWQVLERSPPGAGPRWVMPSGGGGDPEEIARERV